MKVPGLLFAAVILVCAAGTAIASDTFKLRAKVVDVQGNPVEGAEVFMYDTFVTRRPPLFISPKTDTAGSAELVMPVAKYWAVARVRQGEKFGPLGIGARHSGEPAEVEPESAGF